MNKMNKIYHCRRVSSGTARGPALFSADPILFYHVDSETGIVTEKDHSLEGKCISGCILVFPGGKGSSVVQADGMYRLEEKGTAPAGMLVEYLDTVLVSSAVIMEVPMAWKLDSDFYHDVKDGDILEMDTNTGIVRQIPEGDDE